MLILAQSSGKYVTFVTNTRVISMKSSFAVFDVILRRRRQPAPSVLYRVEEALKSNLKGSLGRPGKTSRIYYERSLGMTSKAY